MNVMGIRPTPAKSPSVRKLPSCLPKAFLTTSISIVARCVLSSLQTLFAKSIRPAQVPKTGSPALIFSLMGSKSPSSRINLPCTVLSPPGITNPSNAPDKSLFCLISNVSTPNAVSIASCSAKAPCKASTAIRILLTSFGHEQLDFLLINPDHRLT